MGDKMNTTIDKSQWVFIAIQDPGKNEQIAGLHDKKNNTYFIPAFLKKHEAAECFLNLPRESGKKYEVHAITFEELVNYALKNGFLILILDKEGKILEKISP